MKYLFGAQTTDKIVSLTAYALMYERHEGYSVAHQHCKSITTFILRNGHPRIVTERRLCKN